MEESIYKIVFQGEVAPGQEPAQVRQRIAALLKMDAAGVERLFSGQPMIRRNLSQEQAERYRQAFARAGAVLEVVADHAGDVVPEGPPTRAAQPAPAVPQRPPAAALMTCPKCGAQQPEADDCGACGVVIAKYRAMQEEAPDDDHYYHDAPPPPAPGGLVSSLPKVEPPRRRPNFVAVGCGVLVIGFSVVAFLLMRHPYFRVMSVVATATAIGWIVKGLAGQTPA